ncbi:calponin-like domain-containing protein [Phthorimaea operculella]|nr:calponin-like domain-containing protein [Phthorimaea operculella]
MSERKGTRALELWCKRLVKDCPDVQIENMTTSWRSGMAFCALVHHFRPDLIDMSKLKPENIYENNKLAFSIAEKHLGIPALLDPEDMVENEVPDRLSVLTYLSQFYQRLGHTVNTKSSESDIKMSPSSSTTPSLAPIKFGKTGLDKCAACGQLVYLAQRLMVSHKLYHRRCFRCSKCSGHLNPKNFEIIEGSDFTCDSCKNEKTLSKILNNNDQMGMLAFSYDLPDKPDEPIEEPISPLHRARPTSILEKISMFENKVEKDNSIDNKLANLSLKDTSTNKNNEISTFSVSSTTNTQSGTSDCETDSKNVLNKDDKKINSEKIKEMETPEKVYKTNINKLNFLHTQLSGSNKDLDCDLDDKDVVISKNKPKDCCGDNDESCNNADMGAIDISNSVLKEDSNVTDDIRLAKSHSISDKGSPLKEEPDNDLVASVTVPPRRKKLLSTPEKRSETDDNVVKEKVEKKIEDYPDDLNPFSDDEDEDDQTKSAPPKRESTNPFGSSDEEDDDVPPIKPPPPPAVSGSARSGSPVKRLIHANPFWSDDEEPSSDEDTNASSKAFNSSMTTSTPNVQSTTPRHKKRRAPPPPPAIKVTASHLAPATSMDDVASISSLSSYNSTVHSDQKHFDKLTPRTRKRLAPTPPDSISTVSDVTGSMERGIDERRNSTPDGGSRQSKRPAPGLPLPERREVKLVISPAELQEQLELLETQQLGLERQGVLLEQMIRDKCEGDVEPTDVPQEEVEDLVIQLCELVNEKNDLFRKQTELMYIRRQQRLEQEQADIEHEIRVIQSRPAVNRCDADKAREEQLVSRLVEIVRLRDELVQQLDCERRRERQEDHAIAASIASKRAQRNSGSNSSSMKSGETTAVTPKKNKVKDKVKKQLKKAKNTLHIHKKKDEGTKKDEKSEKDKSK